MIGFGDAADSGPELLALLDAAPPAASIPQASPAPRQAIDAPLVGTLSVAQLGLPLFTLAIGDEPLNLAHILVTNMDGGAQVCNIRGADGQRLMDDDLFPNVIVALEALNPMLRRIAEKVRQSQRPTLGERFRRFFA